MFYIPFLQDPNIASGRSHSLVNAWVMDWLSVAFTTSHNMRVVETISSMKNRFGMLLGSVTVMVHI